MEQRGTWLVPTLYTFQHGVEQGTSLGADEVMAAKGRAILAAQQPAFERALRHHLKIAYGVDDEPEAESKEFGALVRHPGEEYIYVIEGRIDIHTEFYDTVTLEAGESIYIDSNMGHAYVCAEGCKEALVLGVCSAAEEGLMESLMELHGDEEGAQQAAANAPEKKTRLAS